MQPDSIHIALMLLAALLYVRGRMDAEPKPKGKGKGKRSR